MIQEQDLRELVIQPTLEHIGLYSEAAENLLIGTIKQESAGGRYLKQINGPALGIYQIEPATHQDIYENFLVYKEGLGDKIVELLPAFITEAPENSGQKYATEQQLITNLSYATAIARIVYYRRPEALPYSDDIEGLAAYWKQHYNTPLGAGTEEEFIHNYTA